MNEVPDIETQRQQAVESLKFYLEEAGYVDTETHQYIVTDLEAIQKKAELDGSEGIAGKFILENFVQPTGKRQNVIFKSMLHVLL